MFLPVVLCGSVRASSAAAGPTAPAGAVFAVVAHPSFCRSDAACTVPCAAGDAIRWWKELVTGTWYEQATSGARPILRYDATTGYYAEGDGVGRYFAFTHSTVADPKTVGIRMYAPSLTGGSPSCGINSNNNILGRWHGPGGGLHDGGWVFVFEGQGGNPPYQAGVWQSTVASRSGGSTSAYLNGVVNDGTGGDLSHSWTLASFRLFQYSSFFSSDYFHRFVAYDSAVAHATVESWLAEANL